MQALWAVNPRRKRRKSRKLSRKQIAAGFGGKRTRRARKHSRRRSRVTAAATPVIRRRRRSAKRIMRRGRRRSRGLFRMGSGSVMNLLKAGVIGGAGAVTVDVLMGQAVKVLPDNMRSPVDAQGQANLGYFAAKAGVAVALGLYGTRLPFVGQYASRMAEGSLTVLAAQFMRPLAVQAGAQLGAYFSPAPLQRPRQLQGVNRYMSVPSLRRDDSDNRGARASSVVSMVKAQRVAA